MNIVKTTFTLFEIFGIIWLMVNEQQIVCIFTFLFLTIFFGESNECCIRKCCCKS